MLTERHLVDPAKVAEWAEFFPKRMENSAANGSAHPEHLRKLAARLRDYGGQLVNITPVGKCGVKGIAFCGGYCHATSIISISNCRTQTSGLRLQRVLS